MGVESNIKKYFWIILLTNTNLLAPVWTLFFIHRNIDLSQLFILYAIITISMFLFEVPTGIIGDKFGRKTSIVIGRAGFFLMTVGLIFADAFWQFVLLFILWGINLTFISGSDSALIYDSLKQIKQEHRMKKYMGKIESGKYVALIVLAPLTAFFTKDLASWQFISLLVVSAILNLVAVFIGFSMVEPKVDTGPYEVRSPIKLLKSSIKHIKNSPELVRLFLNKTLVLIAGLHIFRLIWQPHLQGLGVPVGAFGILVSVSSLVIFLTNRKIDFIEQYISGKQLIFLTGFLPLLAFVSAAFFANIYVGLVFYFVVKIFTTIRKPVFSQYMNEHIESHNRATVLSSLSMVDSLFDVLLFFTTSILLKVSVAYTFLFSAGLILVALVFFKVTDRHIKVKK